MHSHAKTKLCRGFVINLLDCYLRLMMTHYILMCFYFKVWVDLNQIPSISAITVTLTPLQHQGQNSHSPCTLKSIFPV